MQVSTLLADPETICLEAFVSEESLIVLRVRTVKKQQKCPICQTESRSLHSNYIRRIADLPWHGVAVCLELHTGKFRCRNELCRRKVFCARLPKVVESYGRKTVRLTSVLSLLAFALGGEAGARTASDLNLKVSGDTLLKLIRRRDDQKSSPVRVLGVDDFAFRRGIRYGTILVDLERRQPVDLLPDRESNTLKQWLALHPEVEIISRDRSKTYAEAATNGAPNAIQIADRWHLLKNLGEYLERLLIRNHSVWRNKINQSILSAIESITASSGELPRLSEPVRAEVADRQLARSKLFQQVFQLSAQGVAIEQIAELVGKSSRTIFRWLKHDGCPIRTRNRKSRLDQYWNFIAQWCRDGDYNVLQLWEELREQGYQGSSMAVRRYLHRHKLTAPNGRKRAVKSKVQAENSLKSVTPLISPRASVLKLLHYEKLKEEEKPIIDQILKSSPEIEKAVELGREFESILMGRSETGLEEWLGSAKNCAVAEIKSFARGLEQDKSAVQAAIKYEWSNGQTEGQVNRLKLIKRQMYGCGKFDLLKARVLHQA